VGSWRTARFLIWSNDVNKPRAFLEDCMAVHVSHGTGSASTPGTALICVIGPLRAWSVCFLQVQGKLVLTAALDHTSFGVSKSHMKDKGCRYRPPSTNVITLSSH
jgi:hypothetical protein